MAVAFVANLGSLDLPTTVSGNFTTGAAVAQGNCVVVCGSGSGTRVLTGVTDSKSNTYVVASTTSVNGSTVAASIAVGYIGTALTSTDTITPTFNGTTSGGRVATFGVVSGTTSPSSAIIDQQGSAQQTAVTTLSVATTGATTLADEIAIALFAIGAANTTPAATAPYATFGNGDSTGTLRKAFSEYRVLSATGSQTATGTTGSATTANLIVTLNGVTAAAAVNRRMLLGVG